MASPPQPPFGMLLRCFRLAAGLSQGALARRAGSSERTLSDIERGLVARPRMETVQLLAAALGLTEADRTALFTAARPDLAPPPRPVMPAPQPAHLTPLIGRERELMLLSAFLSVAHPAQSVPPLLLFTGEPGIGKTRLLQAAAQQAVAEGWTILTGGCQRSGGQEPYAPLLDALDHYLRMQPVEQQRIALTGCAWLVRLLPELKGMLEPLPGDTLAPAQERRLMFAAIGRLLANVAGAAGTLLVLDDLQWAGSDALDLLNALLHHAYGGVRLRVVGAYRDSEVELTSPLSLLVADLARTAQISHHALTPLAAQDAATLLDHLLTDAPGIDRMQDARVLRLAGGTPLYLVSYAQALRTGATTETPPWDLTQGVRGRVALLPENARLLLGAAATAGREVDYALLAAVTGQAEEDVLNGLDAACRARLLRESGHSVYAFTHDVIRDVVEADLGAARRTMFHGRLAAALEGVRPAAPPEALAYHFGRSGTPHRAAPYLEAAGDRVRLHYAREAARSYYKEAVHWFDAAGNAADGARARRKLGEVLHDLNRTDEALAVLRAALAVDERRGDRIAQAKTHQAIAAVQASLYNYAAAMPHFMAALELWPPDQEDADLVRLLLDAARARTLAGDEGKGVLAERGAALADRLGEPGLRARGAYTLALALAHADVPPSDAVVAYDRAETLALAAEDRDTLLRVYNNRAEGRRALGDVTGSRADLVRAVALAAELDLAGPLAHICQNLAETCRQLGEWVEGRAAARRAGALNGDGHGGGALLAWMEGDAAGAMRAVAEALEDEQGRGDVQHRCDLLALLADWRLEQGDAQGALQTAREAHALLLAHALAPLTPEVCGPLAEAAALVEPMRDAVETVAAMAALVDQRGAEQARPQMLRAEGILRAREGRGRDALAALRASAEAARGQGVWPQLGRTLAMLCETAVGEPVMAADAEAELATIVARIGPEVGALAWAASPRAVVPT